MHFQATHLTCSLTGSGRGGGGGGGSALGMVLETQLSPRERVTASWQEQRRNRLRRGAFTLRLYAFWQL